MRFHWKSKTISCSSSVDWLCHVHLANFHMFCSTPLQCNSGPVIEMWIVDCGTYSIFRWFRNVLQISRIKQRMIIFNRFYYNLKIKKIPKYFIFLESFDEICCLQFFFINFIDFIKIWNKKFHVFFRFFRFFRIKIIYITLNSSNFP